MWNKRKTKPDLKHFSGQASIISEGTELTGDLNFQGIVQVDGRVRGRLRSSDGYVRVSQGGRVEGDIHVPYVVVDGEVRGNIYAADLLELGKTAKVSGSLNYSRMEIALGARVEGDLSQADNLTKHLDLPELEDALPPDALLDEPSAGKPEADGTKGKGN